MFFGLPTQTPYDLKWRMFGTDIRVTPFFWIMALIFGFQSQVSKGIEYLLIWVVVVFVSILVHEFGHILVGRHYGSRGYIVLHGFGGLAIGSNNLSNRWQRIAVSLGGPGAQLLLLIPCLALAYMSQQSSPEFSESLMGALKPKAAVASKDYLTETLDMMIFVNLFWPLLNLMPVWPLDGGQICRELVQMRIPGTRGQRISLIVSIVTAGLCALFMLLGGHIAMPLLVHLYQLTESRLLVEAVSWIFAIVHPWNAIFFGLLAVMSFLELRNLSGGGGPGWGREPPRQPWQMDPDYWKTGGKPWGN